MSTDYILGLTTIREPKNHDISELGLSNDAVKVILSGNIDMDVLNCLIEHERFPYLLYLIKSYFSDSIAAGIVSRNEIIDLAAAELSEFYKNYDKDKSEIKKDIKALKAQKIGNHEAESEKIKNTFLTILRVVLCQDNGHIKPLFLVKSAKCTNWSHLFHGLLDNEPLMA